MFGSDLENYIKIILILFLEYETKNKNKTLVKSFLKGCEGKKKLLLEAGHWFNLVLDNRS